MDESDIIMENEKEEHPHDLIEKGRKYDEAIEALKLAKEMLLALGYTEDSVGIIPINKVLNN